MAVAGDPVIMNAAASARVIASVYGLALLVTPALAIAALAARALRQSTAGARSLVWRSTVVALLALVAGQQAPLHWIAWVVPSVLAGPLVALGRVQVTVPAAHAAAIDSGVAAVPLLAALVVVYALGVLIVLLPTVVSSIRARRQIARARHIDGAEWASLVASVRDAVGVHRPVRVLIAGDASVASTWGVLRPVVMLPASATAWTAEQQRMVLMHELAHVRAADWLFTLGARVLSALLWFHPGVWWLASELRETCELACDETVLAGGARRSDYAELLVWAADQLPGAVAPQGTMLALARRRGLRARLAAVLDARREVRPLARGSAAAALAVTLCVAGPLSVVRLAPTRDVLTTLMRDVQWESRAYAVLGLAKRADSVAVARAAAERDPSPRVRAWATYALGRQGDLPLLVQPIREP